MSLRYEPFCSKRNLKFGQDRRQSSVPARLHRAFPFLHERHSGCIRQYLPRESQQHSLTTSCSSLCRDGGPVQLDRRTVWGALACQGILIRPLYPSDQAFAWEIRLSQGEAHRTTMGSGFCPGGLLPLQFHA